MVINLVTYEEHEKLLRRIELLEKDNEFASLFFKNAFMLDRRQAAHMLDVCETTLWRITKNGSLPATYEGRRVRYRLEDIRKYLEAR